MIASEAVPWAKTGGLADVLGALPAALDGLGHRVTLVLPKYRGVRTGVEPPAIRPAVVRLGAVDHHLRFETLTLSPRRRVIFVDSPAHFDREGLYAAGGVDHPDNAERFGLLAQAALDWADLDAETWPVDVVHAHDWQAGLAPAWLALEPRRWPRLQGAGRVQTIHNLAYQGVFPRDVVARLGLPWAVFTIGGGEFWGQLSFLKAGINYADVVTTVSPSYARETLTPQQGAGFDGVLVARRDRYVGILNGIDTGVWDPAADPFLPARFDASDLAGKRTCKRALLDRVGLPMGDDVLDRPLVAMVSRLVSQKGLDLVEGAMPSLIDLDATWVFVGTGEARYEAWLRDLASRHPSRVAVFIGFDEALAHLAEAGADLFLMPSLFEPCGLNQMYSLRYGTVPIVHGVGGLDDTIQPYTARAKKANGFKFREATAAALARTVRQALGVYRNPAVWHQLIERGMREDHSWRLSAREYVKVYRRARRDGAVRGPRGAG
ncbi:MAG: glycogen synthase GlgA [Vicinamibacterales bacterium]